MSFLSRNDSESLSLAQSLSSSISTDYDSSSSQNSCSCFNLYYRVYMRLTGTTFFKILNTSPKYTVGQIRPSCGSIVRFPASHVTPGMSPWPYSYISVVITSHEWKRKTVFNNIQDMITNCFLHKLQSMGPTNLINKAQ